MDEESSKLGCWACAAATCCFLFLFVLVLGSGLLQLVLILVLVLVLVLLVCFCLFLFGSPAPPPTAASFRLRPWWYDGSIRRESAVDDIASYRSTLFLARPERRPPVSW